MQRIDASKLLELIFSYKKKGLVFLASDEAIFKRAVLSTLEKRLGAPPAVHGGKTPVLDFVNAVAEGGLFSEPQDCCIELPPKLTSKQWEEEATALKRLPKPSPVLAFVFAPASARNLIKVDALGAPAEAYLAYAPSDADALKCAEILIRRRPDLARRLDKGIQDAAAQALEHYSGDLLACDDHFARMDALNLSSEEALVAQSEVNSFHVVDALARGDRNLLELRMQQCALAGEDAGSILAATVYFLKQVALTQAQLQKSNNNLKAAFEALHVPYPSQARITKALRHFDGPHLAKFFFCAASLELTLRTQRSPHNFLAVELTALIP